MLDPTCLAPAQRHADSPSNTELRGLMHDLGHGLATLSYLVDGLHCDPKLPAEVQRRAALMEKQLDLLRDIVDLRAPRRANEIVEVRGLLRQLVSLTALSTSTWVALRPGPVIALRADRAALWRMVTNLVDNAVRAAGSGGTVELEVSRTRADAVIIELTDDGPGFGAGPRGTAACGLGIVGRLARACGASVRVRTGENRGARVQLVFPPSETSASDAHRDMHGRHDGRLVLGG